MRGHNDSDDGAGKPESVGSNLIRTYKITRISILKGFFPFDAVHLVAFLRPCTLLISFAVNLHESLLRQARKERPVLISFYTAIGAVLVFGLFSRPGALRAADAQVSPITDNTEWKEGKPDSFVGNVHPPVESAVLFAPGEHDWKYSHHQSITAFGNESFAIWSSSERDEDSAGQRVMYAYRNEKGWVAGSTAVG